MNREGMPVKARITVRGSTVTMFGITIHNMTIGEALNQIEYLISLNNCSFVVTPNVDHIVRLHRDEEFRDIYRSANLVLADGMPLIWASKILNKPLIDKVSGSDLFPVLCELAAVKGYKVFLLGAAPGVAAQAAVKLKKDFPTIEIVGIYSPPYGFERNVEENKRIVYEINRCRPDILFVGLGSPKQEKWIYEYKSLYKVPVSLAVGAAFDFVAGSIRRAPRWMQRSGLEWLYRFGQEPRRMFKRYFVYDVLFFPLLIKELMLSRKLK